MTATINLLSTKFYPMLFAILLYVDPIFRTEGDGYLTLFHINIAPLPQNIPLDKYLDTINFTLYTRENPKNGDIIKPNDVESVRNSYWNATKQTILLTHGWIQGGLACEIVRDGKYIDTL